VAVKLGVSASPEVSELKVGEGEKIYLSWCEVGMGRKVGLTLRCRPCYSAPSSMISSQLFVKLANHIPSGFHSHSTLRKALTMSSLRPGGPTYISMGEFGHWFGAAINVLNEYPKHCMLPFEPDTHTFLTEFT
jgi:hypothetical protein